MTLEHAAVREKLIGAALDHMDRGGLEAVTARSVAKQVGVSVGTVYNLYGNVDGLLEAACARIYEDLNRHGLNAIDSFEQAFSVSVSEKVYSDTPRGRLQFALMGLAQVYMSFVETSGKRWGALLAFNRARPVGDAQDWYLNEQNKLIEILVELLKRAETAKSDEEIQTLAWSLWSTVHGIVSMSYVGQARADAREWTWRQIELVLDLIVKGLFAPE